MRSIINKGTKAVKKLIILICSITFALLSSLSLAAQHQTTKFNPSQVKQIEKIVHSYLIKNPKVLVEASRALQAKELAKSEKAALAAIEKNKTMLFDNPATPVAGNPNGNVVIVEFFDYQCGHCKTMNKIMQNLVKTNRNLKVVFKELPIFGNNSRFAAQAALAATKQGKYYKFHDALLATQNPLTPQKVKKIAKKVTLNWTKLQRDMNSSKVKKQIRENFRLAQELKLMGTPAFIVANKQLTKIKFIPGATSQDKLQEQINSVK